MPERRSCQQGEVPGGGAGVWDTQKSPQAGTGCPHIVSSVDSAQSGSGCAVSLRLSPPAGCRRLLAGAQLLADDEGTGVFGLGECEEGKFSSEPGVSTATGLFVPLFFSHLGSVLLSSIFFFLFLKDLKSPRHPTWGLNAQPRGLATHSTA